MLTSCMPTVESVLMWLTLAPSQLPAETACLENNITKALHATLHSHQVTLIISF